jgi:cytochrome c-type biogenesis protein CcmE
MGTGFPSVVIRMFQTGGVSQAAQHLLCKCETKFKPQSHKKKKKKKKKQPDLIKGLEAWLKQQNTCLASMKP